MKKASFRKYYIVYLVSLAVSLVSTTILKLFYTDIFTGFIETPSFFPSLLISVISGLALFIPIIYWFFKTIKRRAKHDFPLSYRHIPSSILAIITGISLLAYSFIAAPDQILNPMSGILSNKIMLLANYVFGFLAGLSMIVGGFNPSFARNGKPGAMLGFCPALWQLILLLTRFNSFIAVTTIRDVTLTVLFMCFAAVFLIGQSRIVYGLGNRDGKSYAIPTGLAVSLIGFTYTVPNMIFYLINGNFASPISMSIYEFIYMFCLSLYAVVFLQGYSHSIKKV